MNHAPTFFEEEKLKAQGYQLVAGIDEVGRGPLAGPVVAAAVILPLGDDISWLFQVRDSKQLTPLKRDRLSIYIQRDALAIGIGVVPPDVIDAHGIVAATRLAMSYAVGSLNLVPDYLLIDAVRLPDLELPQKSIIKGDTLSISIAAASIVAKVTRDRLMVELDAFFPGYGLARNKGYPTSEHLEQLRCMGACPIHRKSFAPVRNVV
ncbi:ribonuclease HII [Chloroflexota bacterium]